jgi:hypothetical protein
MESKTESLLVPVEHLSFYEYGFRNSTRAISDPAACRFSSQTTATLQSGPRTRVTMLKNRSWFLGAYSRGSVSSCDRFDILMEESGSSAGRRQRRRTSTIGVIPIPNDFSVLHRFDIARNSK